ncbi:MAG: hypothetical protein R3Y09_01385 [Clostridia bacterium]
MSLLGGLFSIFGGFTYMGVKTAQGINFQADNEVEKQYIAARTNPQLEAHLNKMLSEVPRDVKKIRQRIEGYRKEHGDNVFDPTFPAWDKVDKYNHIFSVKKAAPFAGSTEPYAFDSSAFTDRELVNLLLATYGYVSHDRAFWTNPVAKQRLAKLGKENPRGY